MRKEQSAGAVVFCATKNGRIYLLLQHRKEFPNRRARKPTSGHWDFPKGHIESGEKDEDTVTREIYEETGIRKIAISSNFKETIRYIVDYGAGKHLKSVALFLAKTKQKRVTLSREHRAYAWLSYKDAYQRLTYSNSKRVLAKAENFLNSI